MASKIEVFAKDVLGIELTKQQVQIVEAIADGRQLVVGRQFGKTITARVCREYIKAGLQEYAEVKPVTNKSGQPIGDFPKDIPTQAEFDQMHAEPIDYGDEGDYLIVSKSVDKQKAFDMIVKRLTDDYGRDEVLLPKGASDLESFDIGWGYDHDSYHYSEGGYWICSPENQVSKRYEAWGVTT